jgi:hypothetical protein
MNAGRCMWAALRLLTARSGGTARAKLTHTHAQARLAAAEVAQAAMQREVEALRWVAARAAEGRVHAGGHGQMDTRRGARHVRKWASACSRWSSQVEPCVGVCCGPFCMCGRGPEQAWCGVRRRQELARAAAAAARAEAEAAAARRAGEERAAQVSTRHCPPKRSSPVLDLSQLRLGLQMCG